MTKIDRKEKAVVVIGSGAGGGTTVYELTKAGIPCVCLEAGRHIIGKPIVLLADVRAAEAAGHEIMKAGTTVYLTKDIPGEFLKKLPDST